MLDLEGNSVEELGQVRYLHLCPRLATLTLEGNPVCLQPGPGPPCQVRALEPTGAGATARVPEGSLSPLVGLEPGLGRVPRAGVSLGVSYPERFFSLGYFPHLALSRAETGQCLESDLRSGYKPQPWTEVGGALFKAGPLGGVEPQAPTRGRRLAPSPTPGRGGVSRVGLITSLTGLAGIWGRESDYKPHASGRACLQAPPP